MDSTNQIGNAASGASPEAVAGPAPTPDARALLEGLPRSRLEAMLTAGHEIRECCRVLRKVRANIVGEVLKHQGTFYRNQHYPKGDVFDAETHAQYYYHAHRTDAGEHGHFHTFLRAKGMPPGATPAPYAGKTARPSGGDALAHLVAISMDRYGSPTHLFTTNRWVTGESFYPAEDVVRMLERFVIDHAHPSWPVNRWISAMFVLFRPQMARLLRQRDRAIADRRARHPDKDVYEDRALEITSITPISVDDQVRAVEELLAAHAA